ncbi:hypothetical protein V565_197630 [Rhizoctonia solani 123E]|uniref:Uncharacterized protein n=1 Tax=Rhizoctonia solani 123E TaxID=1423351 RepID=A0A074RP46_9AGAM|nr:hypothetical protein V565_197630 [Rhizoctonia solani 123E]
MNHRSEITDKKSSQPGHVNARRFTTPLRKVFRRLHVVGNKPTNDIAAPLVDCSNTQLQATAASNAGDMALDEKLAPPPAPKPCRLATPAGPPSPISPLPPSVSRSGNLLITRSREMESPSLLQGPVMSDDAMPECSSPMVPLPRGDLFQLGLTPVPSMRSMVDSECSVFAPAPPTVQRVSSVNIAGWTPDADMMDVVNMDLDDAGKAVTPTPPSRNMSTLWLPNLISARKTASNKLSTTAVFEGGHLAERRRSTFMSKLVGSGWGFSGLGLTSMGSHRRTQSAVLSTSAHETNSGAMGPLPSIPTGKCSIERAVFGPEITAATSVGSSNRNLLINGLPPANSTLRMTGSKSGRAMDHLDLENEHAAPGAKIEERPKKKRRSIAENFMRSAEPTPSPVRVTRAMAARQAEIKANTPTRVTRSTSRRLAESANSPSGKSNAVRSKSVKRL